MLKTLRGCLRCVFRSGPVYDWTRCRVDEYAALSSLGNVPVVYMTALDGWVHDRFGTGWMLQTDALSAILFVVVALFILHKLNVPWAQVVAADNSRVG
jgi:hypothetical protein